MLGSILKQVPVVGSVYGFTKAAMKVYNSTSPVGAVTVAGESILVDCTPPVIKYPILCAALAANGAVVVATGGNPLAVSMFVSCGRLIIED